MKKYSILFILLFIIMNFFVLRTTITSFGIIRYSKNQNTNVQSDILMMIKTYKNNASTITPTITKSAFDPNKFFSFYEIQDKKNEIIGFVAFAYKKLYCDICNDVRLLIITDENATIETLNSLNEIEINGYSIDPSDFLNQFIGKKHTDKSELNSTINNITGATQSAEAIIELIDSVLVIINDNLTSKNINFNQGSQYAK